MLFLESKTLNRAVDAASRTALLQQLQERNLVPLIRTQRLRFFEDVLLGADHVSELEASLANSTDSTTGEQFVRGHIFCFQDYIPSPTSKEDHSLRAGIVY